MQALHLHTLTSPSSSILTYTGGHHAAVEIHTPQFRWQDIPRINQYKRTFVLPMYQKEYLNIMLRFLPVSSLKVSSNLTCSGVDPPTNSVLNSISVNSR